MVNHSTLAKVIAQNMIRNELCQSVFKGNIQFSYIFLVYNIN